MKREGIRSELKKIAAANNGCLRPPDVVDAARPKSSPLHEHFDWDDTDAAEKWRLEQARHLIRFAIQVVEYKGSNVVVPDFVSLSTDRHKGNGYCLTVDIMSNEQKRRQMLADALA